LAKRFQAIVHPVNSSIFLLIELTGESMRKLKAHDELNQDEEGG